MTISEIKEKVENDVCYDFLKTDKHLGKNVLALGLGGSYAYGMNNENSDIDVRGVALHPFDEVLYIKHS